MTRVSVWLRICTRTVRVLASLCLPRASFIIEITLSVNVLVCLYVHMCVCRNTYVCNPTHRDTRPTTAAAASSFLPSFLPSSLAIC